MNFKLKTVTAFMRADLKDLLPEKLGKVIVTKDMLNHSTLLYEFGNPLIINGVSIQSFGTANSYNVGDLFEAVFLANKYLEVEKLCKWLKLIDDPNKHGDYLFEMRPLQNLDPKCEDLKSDVSDYSPGDSDIDWEVGFLDYKILLEVKNRIKPTVEYLGDYLKPPTTSPSVLFSSVDHKFKNCSAPRRLQGVWVSSGITFSEKKLKDYFDEIVPPKIHFAILAGWGSNEAYILARDEAYKDILIRCFGLVESKCFVF